MVYIDVRHARNPICLLAMPQNVCLSILIALPFQKKFSTTLGLCVCKKEKINVVNYLSKHGRLYNVNSHWRAYSFVGLNIGSYLEF